MMIENIDLNAGAFLWGIVLGLFYFGGLWLTVRRLGLINHQALWMIMSFFIRNLLVVIGFYPVILQGWQLTLICLVGFILIRLVLVHGVRIPYSERKTRT